MDIHEVWRRYSGALVALNRYVNDRLTPKLSRLGGLPQRQQALTFIHICSYSVLEPLASSLRATAFRGHAVLCRSLWEHWVDFETIRRASDVEGERYFAFAEIQLWQWFTHRRKTCSSYGLADPSSELDRPDWETHVRTVLRKYYRLELEEIARVKAWDQQTVFERAGALGKDHELHYRELYAHQSWSAHAGAAGVAGMTTEYLKLRALECLRVAFDVASRMSTDLIGELGWHDEEMPIVARIIRMSDLGHKEPPSP